MFSFSWTLIRRIRRNAAAIVAVMVVGAVPLVSPVVTPALADTPSAASSRPGYWLVASDGGIFSFGSARFQGSTGAIHLNQPITGMAPTRSGNGYWMVASDGGIFAFGDAGFFGSTGAIHLNKPITGMATTPTGKGYWLVASDGGIFAFGDAAFFGSTGAIHLNKPITGMATTPTGKGYWLTASDGGIFAFGDAGFFGAAPSRPTLAPRTVVAMVPSPTGAGYWQASTSGELLAFGDAPDLGGVSNLNKPIVSMAAVPQSVPSNNTTTPTVPGGGTTTTTAPSGGPAPLTFSSVANPTWGSPPDPNLPGYSQDVIATLEVGDKLFVAGLFTNIEDPSTNPATLASPAQPYLTVLNAATGQPIAGSTFSANASPDNEVSALAVSPDGQTLYVSGKFVHIGGGTSPRLAALDVNTGKLVATFAPPAPDAEVHALALNKGHLYAGGAFTQVGGSAHALVAEFDASSGALIDSFNSPALAPGTYDGHGGTPNPASPLPPDVHDLTVTADGSYVLAGGNFLHFGTTEATDPSGKQHGGLVALDGTTGALTTWQPVGGRPTFSLFLWNDGSTVFAAKGGGGGQGMAFVVGASKPLWINNVDGDATGIVATATTAYLVGHFNHAGIKPNDPCLVFTPTHNVNCPNGTHNNHLVAFDAKTGFLDTTFTGQADTAKGPDDASLGAHAMYVGGDFNGVADSVTTPCNNGAIIYCKSYRSQPGLAVYPANG